MVVFFNLVRNRKVEMNRIQSVDEWNEMFFIRENQDVDSVTSVTREFQNTIEDIKFDRIQNITDNVGPKGLLVTILSICLNAFLSKEKMNVLGT